MSEIGRKLLIIRNQRKLSLRQVEKLTIVIANRYGDKARRISASWLGRIERESHSIAHKRLESLEEVYGVTHDELTEEAVPEDETTRSLHFHFPDVPAAVLKGLAGYGGPLLPPESWLAYFPATTLLPPLSQMDGTGHRTVRRHSREAEPLYGILGAGDNTLVPFVQPRAIVEINAAGLAPEFVSRIQLSTWYRYRAAAERTQSSVLLLTQHACAKSSAELLLHLHPAEAIGDEATVFTGMRPHIEITRRRFAQNASNVVPLRKPPKNVSGATWDCRTAWAGAR